MSDPTDLGPRPGLISSASAPHADRVSQAWIESTDEASPDETVPTEPPQTASVKLAAAEQRVLGSLIEKSFLTPDVYPMTTNALVSACNQKTNRDPVVDYSAVAVDATLLELRQRGLVRRVHTPGSRATKHRQTLDEVLALSDAQLVLVSVLLLRGPQTIGELRLRTERHDVGFDDLGAVESCLESLASRSEPLVRMLPRQPGHKENRWQHLLVDPENTPHHDAPDERAPHHDASDEVAIGSAAVVEPVQPVGTRAIADLEQRNADHEQRIADLESTVERLSRQLASLADMLGEPLD